MSNVEAVTAAIPMRRRLKRSKPVRVPVGLYSSPGVAIRAAHDGGFETYTSEFHYYIIDSVGDSLAVLERDGAYLTWTEVRG